MKVLNFLSYHIGKIAKMLSIYIFFGNLAMSVINTRMGLWGNLISNFFMGLLCVLVYMYEEVTFGFSKQNGDN